MKKTLKEKRSGLWQYRFVLSDQWRTDEQAMNNPTFKNFSAYERHIKKLNRDHGERAECRLFITNNTTHGN